MPSWWGMKPGYGAGVLLGRRSGTESICIAIHYYSQTLTRLTFVAADGTEYELRDTLTGGKPLNPGIPCGNGFIPSRGTVFVSADGSAVTFISDTVIEDAVIIGVDDYFLYPTGKLMMRDGTEYRIRKGKVMWIRDRNGNKLTFDYDSPSAFGRVVGITDSLNRRVTISYAAISENIFFDQITFQGFGGATRTIKVHYNQLSVAQPGVVRRIGGPTGLFPYFNGASPDTDFDPLVITAVELPDQRVYHLLYNSYGEIARVELPTGGAIEYAYEEGTTAGSGQLLRRLAERRLYPTGGTTRLMRAQRLMG